MLSSPSSNSNTNVGDGDRSPHHTHGSATGSDCLSAGMGDCATITNPPGSPSQQFVSVSSTSFSHQRGSNASCTPFPGSSTATRPLCGSGDTPGATTPQLHPTSASGGDEMEEVEGVTELHGGDVLVPMRRTATTSPGSSGDPYHDAAPAAADHQRRGFRRRRLPSKDEGGGAVSESQGDTVEIGCESPSLTTFLSPSTSRGKPDSAALNIDRKELSLSPSRSAPHQLKTDNDNKPSNQKQAALSSTLDRDVFEEGDCPSFNEGDQSQSPSNRKLLRSLFSFPIEQHQTSSGVIINEAAVATSSPRAATILAGSRRASMFGGSQSLGSYSIKCFAPPSVAYAEVRRRKAAGTAGTVVTNQSCDGSFSYFAGLRRLSGGCGTTSTQETDTDGGTPIKFGDGGGVTIPTRTVVPPSGQGFQANAMTMDPFLNENVDEEDSASSGGAFGGESCLAAGDDDVNFSLTACDDTASHIADPGASSPSRQNFDTPRSSMYGSYHQRTNPMVTSTTPPSRHRPTSGSSTVESGGGLGSTTSPNNNKEAITPVKAVGRGGMPETARSSNVKLVAPLSYLALEQQLLTSPGAATGTSSLAVASANEQPFLTGSARKLSFAGSRRGGGGGTSSGFARGGGGSQYDLNVSQRSSRSQSYVSISGGGLDGVGGGGVSLIPPMSSTAMDAKLRKRASVRHLRPSKADSGNASMSGVPTEINNLNDSTPRSKLFRPMPTYHRGVSATMFSSGPSPAASARSPRFASATGCDSSGQSQLKEAPSTVARDNNNANTTLASLVPSLAGSESASSPANATYSPSFSAAGRTPTSQVQSARFSWALGTGTSGVLRLDDVADEDLFSPSVASVRSIVRRQRHHPPPPTAGGNAFQQFDKLLQGASLSDRDGGGSVGRSGSIGIAAQSPSGAAAGARRSSSSQYGGGQQQQQHPVYGASPVFRPEEPSNAVPTGLLLRRQSQFQTVASAEGRRSAAVRVSSQIVTAETCKSVSNWSPSLGAAALNSSHNEGGGGAGNVGGGVHRLSSGRHPSVGFTPWADTSVSSQAHNNRGESHTTTSTTDAAKNNANGISGANTTGSALEGHALSPKLSRSAVLGGGSFRQSPRPPRVPSMSALAASSLSPSGFIPPGARSLLETSPSSGGINSPSFNSKLDIVVSTAAATAERLRRRSWATVSPPTLTGPPRAMYRGCFMEVLDDAAPQAPPQPQPASLASQTLMQLSAKLRWDESGHHQQLHPEATSSTKDLNGSYSNSGAARPQKKSFAAAAALAFAEGVSKAAVTPQPAGGSTTTSATSASLLERSGVLPSMTLVSAIIAKVQRRPSLMLTLFLPDLYNTVAATVTSLHSTAQAPLRHHQQPHHTQHATNTTDETPLQQFTGRRRRAGSQSSGLAVFAASGARESPYRDPLHTASESLEYASSVREIVEVAYPVAISDYTAATTPMSGKCEGDDASIDEILGTTDAAHFNSIVGNEPSTFVERTSSSPSPLHRHQPPAFCWDDALAASTSYHEHDRSSGKGDAVVPRGDGEEVGVTARGDNGEASVSIKNAPEYNEEEFEDLREEEAEVVEPLIDSRFVVSGRVLTQPSNPLYKVMHSDGIVRCVDNVNGDLVICVGMVLLGWLEVVRELGAGSFGQVVLCKDLRTVLNCGFYYDLDEEETDHAYYQTTEEYLDVEAREGTLVAVKVISSDAAFEQQSYLEAQILQDLCLAAELEETAAIQEGESCGNGPQKELRGQYVCKVLANGGTFGHHCIAMELYPSNLYEYMVSNDLMGLPIAEIRTIARHTLLAMSLTHETGIVHCDVKPENIMIQKLEDKRGRTGASSPRHRSPLSGSVIDSAQPSAVPTPPSSHVDPTRSPSNPSSFPAPPPLSTAGHAESSAAAVSPLVAPLPSKVHQQDTVKAILIDFSSSTREGGDLFDYIQSRYYRAPEVIVGVRYGAPMDVWSVGCVIAEMLLGRPLLPGGNNYQQLFLMEQMFGPLPDCMLALGRLTNTYYNCDDRSKRQRAMARTTSSSLPTASDDDAEHSSTQPPVQPDTPAYTDRFARGGGGGIGGVSWLEGSLLSEEVGTGALLGYSSQHSSSTQAPATVSTLTPSLREPLSATGSVTAMEAAHAKANRPRDVDGGAEADGSPLGNVFPGASSLAGDSLTTPKSGNRRLASPSNGKVFTLKSEEQYNQEQMSPKTAEDGTEDEAQIRSPFVPPPPPVQYLNYVTLTDNIVNADWTPGELELPDAVRTHQRELLADLLCRMLILDPRQRISVDEALQHPFLCPSF